MIINGKLNPEQRIFQEMEGATFDFSIFLDEDGVLAPHALWEFTKILNSDPDIDWIYSDEDFLDYRSKRYLPWFKPDWSPELLLSIDYLKPAVIRRELIARYFEDGKNQLVNTWLETPIYFLNPVSDKVHHSPNVLYYRLKHQKWLKTDRTMESHHRRWVAQYLASCGFGNAQILIPRGNTTQLSYSLSDKDVSIIIPNKNNTRLLRRCVESILEHTHYARFNIILLNTGSEREEPHQFYEEVSNHPKVQVVEYLGPFNYSRVNNYGAQVSSGDYFLFLNDDIEVEGPEWLDELLFMAQIPEIGIVGAKLSFPDRTIQHNGIILGLGGHAGHVFRGIVKGYGNPFGSKDWYRNVLAVTGACMMVRKEVFEELGGFDEKYKMVFSDVEFCLRAVEHGYRVAISPFKKVIHHEGTTRGRYMPLSDLALAFERFTPYLRTGDPYYNPNLSYSKTLPRIRVFKEIDRRDRVTRIVERYSNPIR